MLLLFAAQCAWFIGTQSIAGDEVSNLYDGVQHWRGHPEAGTDNPPLVRLLCALPLLGSPAADAAASHFASGKPVDMIAVAWRTRPMNVVLGLLLGLALWQAARRRFSVGAANFALALFAFSPPLIAHFSMVGTDGVAALMVLLTALQVAAFRRHPNWRQALLTGVVLGLLLLSKLYTLPMFALALLLVTFPSPVHRCWRQWHWGKAAAMVAISCLLVYACYGFRTGELVVRDHQFWLQHHGVIETHLYETPLHINFSVPVPAIDFVHSFGVVLNHGRWGHPAYLLGRIARYGWRYYYPVAIALKWPTLMLVLGIITAVLALLPTAKIPTLSRQTQARQGWGTLRIGCRRISGSFFFFR